MSAEPTPSRSVTHAIALLDPIAEALAHAHARGLSTPSGCLGRTTVERSLDRSKAATGPRPGYGAPEQRSEAYGIPGPWTDVFNLALVFVELLRGLGAEVSPEVEAVVARALAVYPAERWQTAASFWSALRDASWIASGKRPLAQPCHTSSASAMSSVRASTSSATTSPCSAGPTSSSTR